MAEFKINELQEVSEWVESEDRIWLTADRDRLVADGDPEAASLFTTPGKRISRADAIRYGLVKARKGEQVETPDETSGEPVETGAPAAVEVTDSAKKLAKEKGIDLAGVTGTGKDGKVTQHDVQAAVKARDEA